MIKKLLSGHNSAETAYVVEDYPYGFRLRCKIRYWLEYRPKFGFRFVSQTTNPKKVGEPWNKPKAGNYMELPFMYLNEENHVHISNLNINSTEEQLNAYIEKYGEAFTAPEYQAAIVSMRKRIRFWNARMTTEPLHVEKTQIVNYG